MRTAILALVALATGFPAVSPEAEPGVEERIRRVERGLAPPLQIGTSPSWTVQERLGRYRVPGLAIGVIRDFRVEWTRQYGVRDAKSGEPVTASTLFQVASITKPVAATVALRLVEKGTLDLDRDEGSRGQVL